MSIADTIESYRRRRKQLVPIFFGIGAIILVIIGVVLLGNSLINGGGFPKLFSSRTPTSTMTPLATNTLAASETPTISLTPTISITPTASGYWDYTVKEGDTIEQIAFNNGIGQGTTDVEKKQNGVVVILQLNPQIDPIAATIFVGQVIKLSPPNWPILTPTPLPTGLARGSRITYFVLPLDNLGIIAKKFNSTENAIVLANPQVLKSGLASVIYPGQLLIVPIDLVTPAPTITSTLEGIATATPTATPTTTPTITP